MHCMDPKHIIVVCYYHVHTYIDGSIKLRLHVRLID
jgi:hypothetical protein